MKYLTTPNLPETFVKVAIVDSRAEEEIKELKRMGIEIIKTLPSSYINDSTGTHPDMHICHINNNKFMLLEESAEYLEKSINRIASLNDCEKINKVYEHKLTTGTKYPNDCVLNNLCSKEWAIVHKKNNVLNEQFQRIIKVNQGYVKCSVCQVADNAIITADKSIAKAAALLGLDVLITTNDTIELNGYDNGFIGGTCGKISKHELVFFGNIKTHPDNKNIVSFCRNHNVDCISLLNTPLTDYGSLIPIFEE